MKFVLQAEKQPDSFESGCSCYENLLLHDLQNFHGAGLDADAAGDALGGNGRVFCLDQNVEGADVLALAAANAELLVDHVNALGVLGDSAVFADGSALAALHTDHRLGLTLEVHDLNAGLVGIEFLIEGVGTCTDTFQTCHTGFTLLNSQFFHSKIPLC